MSPETSHNEWSPACIPNAWKREGAQKLANAVGFGRAPGVAAAASSKAGRAAFTWFTDAKTEKKMSFEEVHANAATLAIEIRSAAQASGSLASGSTTFTVGLVLRRTAALPIAELAAFKAGATFVPCDPSWPESRINDILTEANVCAVIRDAAPTGRAVPINDQEAVVIDVSETAQIRKVTEGADFAGVDLDGVRASVRTAIDTSADGVPPWGPPEVMYVMYTSGSTGKPKGCIVPTSGLWTHFKWAIDVQKLAPEDVFVLKTTCTFDVSIHEMWVPLVLGCTSVLVEDGDQLDFEKVVETMRRGKVTFAHFVPSVLALFCDYVSPGDLPDLRQIVCIGEALLLSHRAKLTRNFGRSVQLINMYGPTEASVVVTWFDAPDDTTGLTHGFPIGYAPCPEVKLYITDPNDPSKLVPEGEKGEVCIGGVQVAYGYLSRPDLTADKFIPNPHGEPGLMYRTGDLGSVDKDGCFQYNGRADRQVKIGGVRMELGEIEAVCLKLFPQLLNVAVEKVDDKLVGVAAPVPGQELPAPGEINVLLAERLPGPYIPSEWLFRDALPLGSAGKVDHKRVVAWIADQHKAKTWGSIYDEMYFADQFQVEDLADNDPTMDWASYYDSFTGKMHERPTIEEWVDVTVQEVLARKPTSIIEMGCGKGMILFRTAASPAVTRAIGADLSRLAVEHVERTWKSHFHRTTLGPAGHGKLSTYVRDASNFAGFPDRSWSAVVVNGVSLYFPSMAYQVEVLANGLAKVQDGGCFHLGDQRSLQHQRLFCVRKARHMTSSFAECIDRAFQDGQVAKDKDRSYDHRVFYALRMRGLLANAAAVEVQLKHGAIMSEFTRYRYNVLVHVGPTAQALPLVHVADAAVARQPAAAIAQAMAAEAAKSAGRAAVVACRGVPNARLTADKLLVDGVRDAVAPAVQVGAGDGGGICPAELREALAEVLPEHHVVLTWSREGVVDAMDVYAFPKHHMVAGLRAVEADAVAPCLDQLLEADLDLETFVNKAGSMDEDEAKKRDADAEAAALREAKKAWEAGSRKEAVLKVIAAKLGLAAQDGGAGLSEGQTFSDLGGNSFAAMGAIGALREAFGISAPVFELLTLPFGQFAQSAVEKAQADSSGEAAWVVESTPVRGVFRSVSDAHAPLLPTFVFFPMAGGSPKQYAHVYMALRKDVPHARCLFVQPPGRDARASERNETDIEAYTAQLCAVLKPKLVGPGAVEGPTVFIGDSWGSLAAYSVAHRLRADCGFVPDHMVVSGNAAPLISSRHMGLGCYSDTPMADLSDADLEEFLKASGVDEAELSKGGGDAAMQTMVAALRADCQLYEDFKKAPHVQPLPCNALILRGADDAVVKASEITGWADEFCGEEVAFVAVRGASHHLHAEQPDAVSSRLARLVADPSSHVSVRLTRVRGGSSTHTWSHSAANADVLENILGPPCSFVKAVDMDELRKFRAGYFRYRMGSPWGSRGEVGAVAAAPGAA